MIIYTATTIPFMSITWEYTAQIKWESCHIEISDNLCFFIINRQKWAEIKKERESYLVNMSINLVDSNLRFCFIILL